MIWDNNTLEQNFSDSDSLGVCPPLPHTHTPMTNQPNRNHAEGSNNSDMNTINYVTMHQGAEAQAETTGAKVPNLTQSIRKATGPLIVKLLLAAGAYEMTTGLSSCKPKEVVTPYSELDWSKATITYIEGSPDPSIIQITQPKLTLNGQVKYAMAEKISIAGMSTETLIGLFKTIPCCKDYNTEQIQKKIANGDFRLQLSSTIRMPAVWAHAYKRLIFNNNLTDLFLTIDDFASDPNFATLTNSQIVNWDKKTYFNSGVDQTCSIQLLDTTKNDLTSFIEISFGVKPAQGYWFKN